MQEGAPAELGFSPRVLHLPFHPLLLPFGRRTSWAISHPIYFPSLCLACLLSLAYGRPVVLGMKPRTGGPPYVCSRELRREADDACEAGDAYPGFPTRNFVEISGYSFVGWGVIAVDDPAVIRHEYLHVENWLGPYGPGKLAFNLVPLMIAGIFLTPFLGLGAVSLALSLALVLAFSLMAFVKIFH